MSKMATENIWKQDNLFDFEEDIPKIELLPISILKEIENELSNRFLDTEEADQTDGVINFIKEIVEDIKEDIKNFVEDTEKAAFLKVLSKIFTILLSVKVETPEKIISIVKLALSTVLKKWSE